MTVDDITEDLANGSELPSHPEGTTAKKVVELLGVFDSETETPLQRGLHNSEITSLMHGEQMALQHLFRYAIRSGKIYHTRASVYIKVRCEDV